MTAHFGTRRLAFFLSVITRDLNLGMIKLSNRIPKALCQTVPAKAPRYLTSVLCCPAPCASTDIQWPIWHAFWLNSPKSELVYQNAHKPESEGDNRLIAERNS